MFKTTLAVAIASLIATPSFAADWVGEANMGAQGVQGAFISSYQDGLFDLDFGCSAYEGENRTIYMTLLTMPDAPIAPGNETTFPVTMLYTFSDGSTASSDITVEWMREEYAINVWSSSFDMDKTFLKNFGQSNSLQLITNGDEVIFTYHMGGSSNAAKLLVEYCYSGDYS